jgi:hypothetical protein
VADVLAVLKRAVEGQRFLSTDPLHNQSTPTQLRLRLACWPSSPPPRTLPGRGARPRGRGLLLHGLNESALETTAGEDKDVRLRPPSVGASRWRSAGSMWGPALLHSDRRERTGESPRTLRVRAVLLPGGRPGRAGSIRAAVRSACGLESSAAETATRTDNETSCSARSSLWMLRGAIPAASASCSCVRPLDARRRATFAATRSM